jgi:hypothetical protein
MKLLTVVAPETDGDIFLRQEHCQDGPHTAIADYRYIFEHRISHGDIIAIEHTEVTDNFLFYRGERRDSFESGIKEGGGPKVERRIENAECRRVRLEESFR